MDKKEKIFIDKANDNMNSKSKDATMGYNYENSNDEIDTKDNDDHEKMDDIDLLYEVYNEDLNDKEPKKKRKLVGILTEIIFYIVLIYVCAFIVPNYVIQRTIVDGPSMENSLHDGENVLVEKFLYKTKGLERFDIVVFYPYGREHSDYYVKRVIGLPGETVQIIENDIYINGELLEENYGKDEITDAGIAKEPITLSDDQIFVLGDNRAVSMDSRAEEVGPVSLENIGGRVVLRILPLSKFGTVD